MFILVCPYSLSDGSASHRQLQAVVDMGSVGISPTVQFFMHEAGLLA